MPLLEQNTNKLLREYPKKSREESLEEINGKEADRMLDKLNRQTRKLLEYLLSFQVHHPMSSRLV